MITPKFDDVKLIKTKNGWTLRVERNPDGVVSEEEFEQAVMKLSKALADFDINVRYIKGRD
tara:strand:- start:191 stop:373 length:183 start_codon:yes stop_codon:yes gene_type:complete